MHLQNSQLKQIKKIPKISRLKQRQIDLERKEGLDYLYKVKSRRKAKIESVPLFQKFAVFRETIDGTLEEIELADIEGVDNAEYSRR